MRAAVELVLTWTVRSPAVSLVGNISTDGSATFSTRFGRLAELTKARHYPMPLPSAVIGSRTQPDVKMSPVTKVRALRPGRTALVGVGRWTNAQFYVDGSSAVKAPRTHAAGPWVSRGWAFDRAGRFIKGGTTGRVTACLIPFRLRSYGRAALGRESPAIRPRQGG